MIKFCQSNSLKVLLLSASTFITLGSVLTNPVSAQSVHSHTGLQLNINKDGADQTNNVQFNTQAGCTGNVTSTISTQVAIGGSGRNRQHQEARHTTSGCEGNPTGINGPTIKNNTVVDVDVRTPQNFPY